MTTNEPALRVISLGWGVQSWALAAMSALGVLPRVDYAIHADTTYERSETYEFAEKWTPWLEARGVPVVTVSAPDSDRRLDAMPLYAARDGERIQGQRMCTNLWKIKPIQRWIGNELVKRQVAKRTGNGALQAVPGAVEMWMGITLDEVQRVKPSRVKYIRHAHPLVNMAEGDRRRIEARRFMPGRMSRADVVAWLVANDLEVPVSSGCVMCPYYGAAKFAEIKDAANGNWARATAIDGQVRNLADGMQQYVYNQYAPLSELTTAQDAGQLSFFEMDECEGGCFL